MASTHLRPLSLGPSEAPQPRSPLSEPLLQPEVRAKQHLSRSIIKLGACARHFKKHIKEPVPALRGVKI